MPPVAALGRGDGEFERGLAGGATEDGGAGKQPPAQGGQFGTLRLTGISLEKKELLIGGHTVRDREIKFGYAVTGAVDPARMWTNAGARPGAGDFISGTHTHASLSRHYKLYVPPEERVKIW